jgi:hypothetical protein
VGKAESAGRRTYRNGDANKLATEDRPAHDWFRFVLSFPPHLVRDYLERFQIGSRQHVLDPFCGTGTTVVECKKQGVPSIGVEANPMAHFAGQVKVDWSPSPEGLLRHASLVGEAALARLEADGIEDEPEMEGDGFFPLFKTEKRRNGQRGTLRTIEPEKMKLLLTDSISPLPLHKTLVLLDCLKEQRSERYERHELLALAKAIVFSISNLHFGPEVGVAPAKQDAAVISAWLKEVRTMAADLRDLQTLKEVPAQIYHGDSREVSRSVKPKSVDAVITSPPYPNEKDYTRTTRLESVLLGFVKSKADIQALKKGLVRSNTRSVYKGDEDDKLVAGNKKVQAIAEAIEKRRLEMGKTSGFERMYHRVTKLYFGGMARHFADLRAVLRPGAHLAYVVGDQASYLRIMIRTGELLAEIAESLGYQRVGIDLFRTRLSTTTKEQLREEVVLLRWPG